MIADDCDPLYEGQPRCSAVVAQAAQLGFEPATPLRCRFDRRQGAVTSSWRRNFRRTAWGCELEVVFLRRGVPMMPPLWRFHNLAQNGCGGVYPSLGEVTNGSIVLTAANKWVEKGANGSSWRMRYVPSTSAARYRDGLYSCVTF